MERSVGQSAEMTRSTKPKMHPRDISVRFFFVMFNHELSHFHHH